MLLDFGDKRLATVAANSVVVGTRAPQVELYGLQGTVALDPIDVGAPLELLEEGSGWQQVTPPFPGARPNERGSGPDHHLGVEHLVDCIEEDREPLLNIDHALHVVEIIEKCGQAAKSGQTLELTTTFPFQQ
jgi:predicted dehydrogenase